MGMGMPRHSRVTSPRRARAPSYEARVGQPEPKRMRVSYVHAQQQSSSDYVEPKSSGGGNGGKGGGNGGNGSNSGKNGKASTKKAATGKRSRRFGSVRCGRCNKFGLEAECDCSASQDENAAGRSGRYYIVIRVKRVPAEERKRAQQQVYHSYAEAEAARAAMEKRFPKTLKRRLSKKDKEREKQRQLEEERQQQLRRQQQYHRPQYQQSGMHLLTSGFEIGGGNPAAGVGQRGPYFNAQQQRPGHPYGHGHYNNGGGNDRGVGHTMVPSHSVPLKLS